MMATALRTGVFVDHGDRTRWMAAAACAALCATLADAPRAAPAAWTCWLHAGQQIACLSAADADGGPRVNVAGVAPRDLLRTIRQRPGALRGQVVYMPLFTVPTGDGRVRELARAVLCGSNPPEPCEVGFERDPSRLAGRAMQALVDAADPVLTP